MSIGAVFQRWLAILAALAVGLRERWRARRVLVVARDGDGFVFRRDAAAGNEVRRLRAGRSEGAGRRARSCARRRGRPRASP